MILTSEILKHIKQEAESIQFGRIIIELNAESGKIHVITESRKRFLEKKFSKKKDEGVDKL